MCPRPGLTGGVPGLFRRRPRGLKSADGKLPPLGAHGHPDFTLPHNRLEILGHGLMDRLRVQGGPQGLSESNELLELASSILCPPRISSNSIGVPLGLLVTLGLTQSLVKQEAKQNQYQRRHQRLKLNFPVIEPVLEILVEQRYVAIVDGGMIGRSSYTYRISDAGRERAQLFLENNHYVGSAPVPLQQYQDYMTSLESAPAQHETRDALRCQGRSKIRPPWRRKTRPLGSWVEWRNAAVRRGRQDAGVAAGWRAFLLCSRR